MTQIHKTWIAVLPGDGIGPEVTNAALAVLADCASTFGHTFDFRQLPFGRRGHRPLRRASTGRDARRLPIIGRRITRRDWRAEGGSSLKLGTRPGSRLAGIASAARPVHFNLRPIRVRPALQGISPLRADRIANCDFEIVRGADR